MHYVNFRYYCLLMNCNFTEHLLAGFHCASILVSGGHLVAFEVCQLGCVASLMTIYIYTFSYALINVTH